MQTSQTVLKRMTEERRLKEIVLMLLCSLTKAEDDFLDRYIGVITGEPMDEEVITNIMNNACSDNEEDLDTLREFLLELCVALARYSEKEASAKIVLEKINQCIVMLPEDLSQMQGRMKDAFEPYNDQSATEIVNSISRVAGESCGEINRLAADIELTRNIKVYIVGESSILSNEDKGISLLKNNINDPVPAMSTSQLASEERFMKIRGASRNGGFNSLLNKINNPEEPLKEFFEGMDQKPKSSFRQNIFKLLKDSSRKK